MTMYLGVFTLFDLAPVVKSLGTPGRQQIGRSAHWEKDAKVLILFQDAWEKTTQGDAPSRMQPQWKSRTTFDMQRKVSYFGAF